MTRFAFIRKLEYNFHIMRAKELEKLFRVLGNKRRIQIIKLLLKKGELSVSEIADKINLSLKATSRHLMQLFHIDVLKKDQRSKNVYYGISGNLNLESKSAISYIHHSGE